MPEPIPESNEDRPSYPEPAAEAPVPPPLPGTTRALDDPHLVNQSLGARSAQADLQDPSHQLPESSVTNGRMTQTAEKIGSAVGTAQRQVRQKFEVFTGRGRSAAGSVADTVADKTEAARQRTSELAEVAATRASEIAQSAQERIADVTSQAAERASQAGRSTMQQLKVMRRRVQHALYDGRERARVTADRYPLQTVAAVAGACFVLGVVLRIWRSNRG